MRESKIEDYLVKQCKLNKWEVRKVEWIARSGAPDRFIFIAGGVWVELKATGEKPRPDQVREHKKMLTGGIKVFTIDSIEGVDNLVNHINGILFLTK